ncbi:hypothetical protein T07_1553 [Trichinella nelsoni]|uniref:Uncharacterized protein n=1 Tax=Trichinella nelsoni TaxID=6336 RepID=A0A0V0RB62_9BILA|nr:hypothetical protein T07_1553 [Trichinella nelsoni]
MSISLRYVGTEYKSHFRKWHLIAHIKRLKYMQPVLNK